MKKLLLGFCISSLFASVLCFASKGGDSSGGGDEHALDTGSAWFMGNRPVRYCFEATPDFGVSTEIIAENIEAAFQTWREALKKSYVGASIQERISMSAQPIANCDGTEDLKFYFGVTNGEVSKAKALYEDPVAFAYRRSYNRRTGWGNGFIWVASPGSVLQDLHFPDWTQPHRLSGILIHEIGHVFGCEHMAGTIMDERIGQILRADKKLNLSEERVRYKLTHVNDTVELLPVRGITLEGRVYQLQSLDRAIQALLGKKPLGVIKPKLRIGDDAQQTLIFEETGTNGKLLGTYEFVLTFKDVINYSAKEMFYTVKQNEKGFPGTDFAYISSEIQSVNIIGKDGKKHLALLDHNTGADAFFGGPYGVRLIQDGELVRLFGPELGQSP